MRWSLSPKTTVRIIAGVAGIVAIAAFLTMMQSAYGFLFSNENSSQIADAWRFAMSFGALIALIVIVLAVVDSVAESGPVGHYAAALAVTAATVPAVAAAAMVIAYIARLDSLPDWNRQLNDLAVLVGVVVALISWLLSALVIRRCVTPQRMNSRTYSDLRLRLSQIDARLKTLRSNQGSLIQQISYNEAVEHRNAIAHDLGCKHALSQESANPSAQESVEGLRWVMATGYVSLWSRVHRAEEALFELNPIEQVVSDGLYDELRLSNSNIPGRDDLQNKVRLALEVLEPAATKYYTNCSITQKPKKNTRTRFRSDTSETNGAATGNPNSTSGSSGTSTGSMSHADDLQGSTPARVSDTHDTGDTSAPGTSVPATISTVATSASNGHGTKTMVEDQAVETKEAISCDQARSILREVRCSINSFRDGRWDGIVYARNRLMKTGIFTSLAAYVLLCIPVIVGAPPETIVAAVVFYLVGAIVGLISRLRTEEGSSRAVQDYGLTTVRLIHTPLFSGIAAIGGVMVINLLPSLLNRLTPMGNTSSTLLPAVPLSDIFSLTQNQMGLIIAAVFGLTPGLLIDRLMKASDQYKADLQSSETSSGGNTSPATSNQVRVGA